MCSRCKITITGQLGKKPKLKGEIAAPKFDRGYYCNFIKHLKFGGRLCNYLKFWWRETIKHVFFGPILKKTKLHCWSKY